MKAHPLKRFLDVAVSLVALGFLWPLMAVLAIWVRFDSPGPVIFRQIRVGREQTKFQILKFRTMLDRGQAIDQVNEHVVTAGRDARITRSGRFLRASSLDELPQLINILRGEMSLVGPRPVIPEQLTAIPPARLDRFALRPGLTGLAQVKGRRSLDWPEQLALDCEYVNRWSLLLDVRILIQTVVVVVKASDVYGGQGSNWRAYRRGQEDSSDGAER